MIVTRFPPSPTGFLHIGNARTALFNWCFARANNGAFVLRVEDTDKKRSTEPAIQAIFDSLDWLNIDHDHEAVYQSQNIERHSAVALDLLDKGKAYWCYCTPEELAKMREDGNGYDGTWRDRDPVDAPADIKPVLRIKAPQTGETIIDDMVQGKVTVANTQLDDFILLRADGSPTYMLAVVVDDHDMGVTHIIRGDDHLNNAFRQKIIIDAMQWPTPVYAHCPLLHGEDGSKFSKRHGALGVLDYAEQGYLPEALFNYLMRLGWSHGDDEIFTREQALEWFSLEGINKAPARFDLQKLNHINAHYMSVADPKRLISLLPYTVSEQQEKWLIAGMTDLVERAITLVDLAHEAEIYVKPNVQDNAAPLIADNQETIRHLLSAFSAADGFSTEAVQGMCKDVADTLHNGKLGKVGMPLRAAITGRKASPGIFDVCAILGKEETCNRLRQAFAD